MTQILNLHQDTRPLYDLDKSHDNCGVGFITHKESKQTFDLMKKGHEALCVVPHRGGMNAQGVGDGAGILMDIPLPFFRRVTGYANLQHGDFGVGNFFFPEDESRWSDAKTLIKEKFRQHNMPILEWRFVPVDTSVVNEATRKAQPTIHQVVFARPFDETVTWEQFDRIINECLHEIHEVAFSDPQWVGFFPISMSTRTIVYKGRLNSGELVPYFKDLNDPDFQISIFLFHTRFSTNTAPAPMMAQPFHNMAHNGELNTNRKNVLSEQAVALAQGRVYIAPPGQSDSCRLDQTISRRMHDDNLSILDSICLMMPQAWENDTTLPKNVRAMLEYHSLFEEKNDGPAALIFSDGITVGAKLDRLGLRPLRVVESTKYLAVMSEAGQIKFDPSDVVSRSRIDAGGMIVFDHAKREILTADMILNRMAQERPYEKLLVKHMVRLSDLKTKPAKRPYSYFDVENRYIACGLNVESFRQMLDPIIESGAERVTGMGYGNAINALSNTEGNISKYFSQRFAQVTNPPLDSIRESDGMTTHVSIGANGMFVEGDPIKIMLETPVINVADLMKIRHQDKVNVITLEALYPLGETLEDTRENFVSAVEDLANQAANACHNHGIIVLSDANITPDKIAIPMILAVSAVNQKLIKAGLRFHSSIVVETGQATSSHDYACLLGFGASAVCSLAVYDRIVQTGADCDATFKKFRKGIEKALLKTMGKFGLCTVESYSGGEFFESSFLDTKHGKLAKWFPNVDAPVGGARLNDIIDVSLKWHGVAVANQQATNQQTNNDKSVQLPILGLFKERSNGGGHSYGVLATQRFIDMCHEGITYANNAGQVPLNTVVTKSLLRGKDSDYGSDTQYLDFGYDRRTPEQIDAFKITKGYRTFVADLTKERLERPSALRDMLDFPLRLQNCMTKDDFLAQLKRHSFTGNKSFEISGMRLNKLHDHDFFVSLTRDDNLVRLKALAQALVERFGSDCITIKKIKPDAIRLKAQGKGEAWLEKVLAVADTLDLENVQPAHEITATFATAAMSHGALNKDTHEHVSMGGNIAGCQTNSGEGGEKRIRYNSVKSSSIKQIASGRFGVWAGYFSDPNLREVEIKIAQGAKPGEGGQLPAHKVTVEIASSRGGTPFVELVSPPPHHDTYSIEDLGQLIHDCHATGAKVIVKLVSSEGIGTIAVGVAKAGADVINVAGNTGGTAAAQVTSLKHTGRAAEIGLAEVHQALCRNGLRNKVILRTSGAHQCAEDVVKSAILGADSFEFGTTALMMLGCVMAKNCNIACPAGLTTDPEIYRGDPRALAQYFMNVAHEVREYLARLGCESLLDLRGRTHLLHLINHPNSVGQLDVTGLLDRVEPYSPKNPRYVPFNYRIDDAIEQPVFQALPSITADKPFVTETYALNNCDKSLIGQFAVKLERYLNFEASLQDLSKIPALQSDIHGRRSLKNDSIVVRTTESAGQSYGVWMIKGITLEHTGTCNDGVGKGMSGGIIVVKNPGLNENAPDVMDNYLVGNFVAFGATGGALYVNGGAGDRCGVRNSGATLVVEGVGDFACEYMVNGAFVNLGRFGKGFGTGMSGGVAYQYDPAGILPKQYSDDSVYLSRLGDSTQSTPSFAQSQQDILHQLLSEHVRRTGSPLGQSILDNWDNEKANFWVVEPLGLRENQQASYIAKTLSDKNMVDELVRSYVYNNIRELKRAYDNQAIIFDGIVPSLSPDKNVPPDMTFISKMVNQYVILQFAKDLAESQLQSEGVASDDYTVGVRMKKLILTEEKKLADRLLKAAKDATVGLTKEQLATLLSDRRLRGYQESLRLRDVQDYYAIVPENWVAYNDALNADMLADIGTLDERIAAQWVHSYLLSLTPEQHAEFSKLAQQHDTPLTHTA